MTVAESWTLRFFECASGP